MLPQLNTYAMCKTALTELLYLTFMVEMYLLADVFSSSVAQADDGNGSSVQRAAWSDIAKMSTILTGTSIFKEERFLETKLSAFLFNHMEAWSDVSGR